MATITGLWQTLFRLAPRLPGSDRELLARFAETRDQPAFAELVRRHGRKVYRSLIGILGSADEAEDAMQDAFLKAFQHIGEFEGRSTFSTWLVRIAINTGVQSLRGRREIGSLDEEDEEFRPRQIQAWQDDPEQSYSKDELRGLIEMEMIDLVGGMIGRRVKAAKFPAVESVDSFDFKAIRALNKMQVLELARCAWVERRENGVVLGLQAPAKPTVHSALGDPPAKMASPSVLSAPPLSSMNR